MNPFTTGSATVLRVFDLILYIMHTSAGASIIVHSEQKVANMVLKRHIRQSLQKYLGTSDLVVDFLLVMQSSDAVVYASFALWILIGDQGKGWVPNNLNISIPKGKVKLLSVLLSAQGYQEVHYGVGWQWEQSVRTYIHFMHLVLHRTVILCESATWTVLPVVLSASSMASMIAVIPHLAGYRVPKDGARLLHLQRGFVLTADTTDWVMPYSADFLHVNVRRATMNVNLDNQNVTPVIAVEWAETRNAHVYRGEDNILGCEKDVKPIAICRVWIYLVMESGNGTIVEEGMPMGNSRAATTKQSMLQGPALTWTQKVHGHGIAEDLGVIPLQKDDVAENAQQMRWNAEVSSWMKHNGWGGKWRTVFNSNADKVKYRRSTAQVWFHMHSYSSMSMKHKVTDVEQAQRLTVLTGFLDKLAESGWQTCVVCDCMIVELTHFASFQSLGALAGSTSGGETVVTHGMMLAQKGLVNTNGLSGGNVCLGCLEDLQGCCMPELALNGSFCLHEIPEALEGLKFLERLLVSLCFPIQYTVEVQESKDRRLYLNVVAKPLASTLIILGVPVKPMEIMQIITFHFPQCSECADYVRWKLSIGFVPTIDAWVTTQLAVERGPLEIKRTHNGFMQFLDIMADTFPKAFPHIFPNRCQHNEVVLAVVQLPEQLENASWDPSFIVTLELDGKPISATYDSSGYHLYLGDVIRTHQATADEESPRQAAQNFDTWATAVKSQLLTGKNDNGLFGKSMGFLGRVEQREGTALAMKLLLWVEDGRISPVWTISDRGSGNGDQTRDAIQLSSRSPGGKDSRDGIGTGVSGWIEEIYTTRKDGNGYVCSSVRGKLEQGGNVLHTGCQSCEEFINDRNSQRWCKAPQVIAYKTRELGFRDWNFLEFTLAAEEINEFGLRNLKDTWEIFEYGYLDNGFAVE
ncbi:hypothetical protein L208DRAFT_1380900 [Tricholoma matsutake]|nr:hypothetical protein L208DRAFT_1380900 [Tricholoma matsutake 945]